MLYQAGNILVPFNVELTHFRNQAERLQMRNRRLQNLTKLIRFSRTWYSVYFVQKPLFRLKSDKGLLQNAEKHSKIGKSRTIILTESLAKSENSIAEAHLWV